MLIMGYKIRTPLHHVYKRVVRRLEELKQVVEVGEPTESELKYLEGRLFEAEAFVKIVTNGFEKEKEGISPIKSRRSKKLNGYVIHWPEKGWYLEHSKGWSSELVDARHFSKREMAEEVLTCVKAKQRSLEILKVVLGKLNE